MFTFEKSFNPSGRNSTKTNGQWAAQSKFFARVRKNEVFQNHHLLENSKDFLYVLNFIQFCSLQNLSGV